MLLHGEKIHFSEPTQFSIEVYHCEGVVVKGRIAALNVYERNFVSKDFYDQTPLCCQLGRYTYYANNKTINSLSCCTAKLTLNISLPLQTFISNF